MKKSTFLGSTVGVLLLFSIISYSQNLVQQQQSSKSNQEKKTQAAGTSVADTATTNSSASESTERPREVSAPAKADEKPTLGESFEATAYSLHGRTASGAAATTGMIAADPRVLPIGSRVKLEAGSYSGEYLVADTGGAVKGKRIDIWTPSSREAMRFGRRNVKLTVLHLAGKRGAKSTRPRTVMVEPSSASPATANPKQ
jgi:3D (Asp-Asp-Asp) domain-containing protein